MWVLYAILASSAWAITPYSVESGSTFYVEASRELTWPSCPYRFLSVPGTCDSADLWSDVGINQEWTLKDTGNGTYSMQSSCGGFFSYSTNCDNHGVTISTKEDPSTQALVFVTGDNTQFEYYISAGGRGHCSYQWLSFPRSCTTSSPDIVDMWQAAGPDQRFRLHPVRTESPIFMEPISDSYCADPFVWFSKASGVYALQCTGGNLPLSLSSTMGMTAQFSLAGDSLSGVASPWASDPSQRWAPENYECKGVDCSSTSTENYVFFSSASDATNNVHRIGYSLSTTGVESGAWSQYSESYLNLGNSPGGEIDQTVFVDDDGKTYFLWKSDDNNVGDSVTRIWMQEVIIGNFSVSLLGSPLVVMDSTGMWWVDSWVNDGSLVEGPEMLKANGYYYLFFAGGRYCQESYSEGVARAVNIWGPYEKMKVPLLSSGIVGKSEKYGGADLVGPGHGSLVTEIGSGDVFFIFHANLDSQCNRFPFIAGIKFGYDNWPFADF